ncbi:MAG: hypothetical protein M3Y93_03055 [Pseudomonadota bacterium]|nr:hypothetical protein [Pseudomonadota bacterium]
MRILLPVDVDSSIAAAAVATLRRHSQAIDHVADGIKADRALPDNAYACKTLVRTMIRSGRSPSPNAKRGFARCGVDR